MKNNRNVNALDLRVTVTVCERRWWRADVSWSSERLTMWKVARSHTWRVSLCGGGPAVRDWETWPCSRPGPVLSLVVLSSLGTPQTSETAGHLEECQGLSLTSIPGSLVGRWPGTRPLICLEEGFVRQKSRLSVPVQSCDVNRCHFYHSVLLFPSNTDVFLWIIIIIIIISDSN